MVYGTVLVGFVALTDVGTQKIGPLSVEILYCETETKVKLP